MNDATHRCKICKALWRLNAPCPATPNGSWSCLTVDTMGKCCANVAMGDQIEVLFPGPWTYNPVHRWIVRRLDNDIDLEIYCSFREAGQPSPGNLQELLDWLNR